jgi:hypothetical protein
MNFNRWLIFFCFTTSVFLLFCFNGFLPWLLAKDHTYLSHFTIAFYFYWSLRFGLMVKQRKLDEKCVDEACNDMMKVGIFATAVALLYGFTHADLAALVGNTDGVAFPRALVELSNATAVALIPFAAGMLGEWFLTIQWRLVRSGK